MCLHIVISLYFGPNLMLSLMQGPLYSKEILVYAVNNDAGGFYLLPYAHVSHMPR